MTSPEAVSIIGLCVTVITVVGGAMWTSRRAKAGDEKTSEVQADAGIASGYSLLTQDLRAELDRREKQQAAEFERQQRLIDGLRMDVDAIKNRHRSAITYVRVLLAFIAQNLPGHVPPAPPSDLTLDLD